MITDARTGIAERVADRPALRLPVTETTAPHVLSQGVELRDEHVGAPER